MKNIDWRTLGKEGLVLLVATLGLPHLAPTDGLLILAGLLLYLYLGMRWCCQA